MLDAMSTTKLDTETESDPPEEPTLFVDAATRVSNPSAFDRWYYNIEDRLGQGTVGMGICLIVFILAIVIATLVNPI
jgi:hypothetical protein